MYSKIGLNLEETARMLRCLEIGTTPIRKSVQQYPCTLRRQTQVR